MDTTRTNPVCVGSLAQTDAAGSQPLGGQQAPVWTRGDSGFLAVPSRHWLLQHPPVGSSTLPGTAGHGLCSRGWALPRDFKVRSPWIHRNWWGVAPGNCVGIMPALCCLVTGEPVAFMFGTLFFLCPPRLAVVYGGDVVPVAGHRLGLWPHLPPVPGWRGCLHRGTSATSSTRGLRRLTSVR